MLLNITNFSAQPIYNQIVQQILLRILEEDKLPGDEIESISKLSRQHHIGKTSIERAFDRLEKLGVISLSEQNNYVINHLPTKELKKLIDRSFYNSQSFSEYDLFNAELEAAKQIQNDLLPKNLPNNKSIETAAFSTIPEEVGGDFYDIFDVDENKYGIIIGDASGKGLPAAMLISQIQAIIKSDISLNRTIRETVFLLNSYLHTYSAAKNFATLFYGILDLTKGNLEYINAGHNFPIIIDTENNHERLKTTGPALGIMATANFSIKTVGLKPNNLLFLFTDGLIERMDDDNIQFGEDRVIDLLTDSSIKNTAQIVKKISRQISNFSGKNCEVDDTTFMAIKIKSK
jgi:sigma-B regulation protein RsbU (phosphoserine phosphatase)